VERRVEVSENERRGGEEEGGEEEGEGGRGNEVSGEGANEIHWNDCFERVEAFKVKFGHDAVSLMSSQANESLSHTHLLISLPSMLHVNQTCLVDISSNVNETCPPNASAVSHI